MAAGGVTCANGFHSHGGYPKRDGLKFTMENPHLKWMRIGGTPILGHLHIYEHIQDELG